MKVNATMPSHVDPITDLEELQLSLGLGEAALERIKQTLARREAVRKEMLAPDFVDLRRYAKVAAEAALRHVEHERNMVRGQLEAAIHSALLRDYSCKAYGRACAAQDAEHRDRRPAAARLDDLQQQIRAMS
jgi:hypothetical protein